VPAPRTTPESVLAPVGRRCWGRPAVVAAVSVVELLLLSMLLSVPAAVATAPAGTTLATAVHASPSPPVAAVVAPPSRGPASDPAPTPTWVNLSSEIAAPFGWTDPLTAYDPLLGGVVYYGGLYCTSPNAPESGCKANFYGGETLLYANGVWTNISAAVGAPQPASGDNNTGEMVYDPAIPGLVLWSDIAVGYITFTYEYSPATWILGAEGWRNTSINPAVQPGELNWMAYDPVDGYVVGLGPLGATWVYNTSGGWRQLVNPLPVIPNSFPGALAWDPAAGELVLAGAGRDLNGTWTFLHGNWTNATTPGTGPTSIGYHALPLVYSAVLGGLVAYAGSQGSALDERTPTTWLYANGTWTNISYKVGPGPGADDGLHSGAVAVMDGWDLFIDPIAPQKWPTSFVWALTNLPVAFLSASPTTVEAGLVVTITGAHFGGPGPFTTRITGLPPGCGPTDSLPISCRPTTPGSYLVNLTVSDSVGGFGNASVNVTVGPALNATFVPGPSPIDLGAWWNLTVTPAGGFGPYEFTYANMPGGCSSTTGYLACRPSQTGHFAVQAIVTDAVGVQVNWTGSLIVNADPSLTVVSNEPETEVGEPILLTVNATGGTGTLTLAWSDLPPGCTAPSGTTLTCVPTAVGNFVVIVRGGDGLGITASGSVDVAVLPAILLGGFTDVPGPNITVGAGVLFDVNVSDGIPPYSYAYAGLPPGCVGGNQPTVSCQPPTGHFTSTVTVTDSRGATVHGSVSLNVSPAAPPSPLPYLYVGGAIAGVLAVGVYAWRRPRPPPVEEIPHPAGPVWGKHFPPPE
jgi:hypothetical protein